MYFPARSFHVESQLGADEELGITASDVRSQLKPLNL